jgi:hypothetical protein
MKGSSVLAALAAVALLAGCNQPVDPAGQGGEGRGRYVGLGHYAPGRMWSQIVRASSADTAAARPQDDEQVLIVMDSVTGEVRQCGNLSGACVGLSPWSGPLTQAQRAPLPLAMHASQLEAEDRASLKSSPD